LTPPRTSEIIMLRHALIIYYYYYYCCCYVICNIIKYLDRSTRMHFLYTCTKKEYLRRGNYYVIGLVYKSQRVEHNNNNYYYIRMSRCRYINNNNILLKRCSTTTNEQKYVWNLSGKKRKKKMRKKRRRRFTSTAQRRHLRVKLLRSRTRIMTHLRGPWESRQFSCSTEIYVSISSPSFPSQSIDGYSVRG